MTLLEVAKHALEAMEDAMYRADTHEFYDAKESLRYAIEQAEQVEQEPVAVALHTGTKQGIKWHREVEHGTFLYTAPTPRNEPVIDKTMAKRIATQLGWRRPRPPLTDEEIALISVACAATHRHDDFSFARAIERAHGIKEQEHE